MQSHGKAVHSPSFKIHQKMRSVYKAVLILYLWHFFKKVRKLKFTFKDLGKKTKQNNLLFKASTH